MASGDPALQPLLDLWTRENGIREWRIRFKDGAVFDLTHVFADESLPTLPRAVGLVTNVVRASAGHGWSVGDEAWFELSLVVDVTDVADRVVVFPSSAAPGARTPRPRRTRNATLGAVGLVLLSAIFIGEGIRGRLAYNARKKWPTAPAYVEALDLTSRTRAATRTYHPVVRFSYEVNGAVLTSGVLTHDNRPYGHSVDEALQLIPFRQGDSVQARVNPSNASDAVLLVGQGHFRSELLFVLAPLLWFGAFLWWHSTIPQKSGPHD